jgi:hypothetical protein
MTTNLTQKYGPLEQCGLTEALYRTQMGYRAHAIYHRPSRGPRLPKALVTQCLPNVSRFPKVESWQYPGWWTHVPSRQVTVGPRGWGRGFVAVTTEEGETVSSLLKYDPGMEPYQPHRDHVYTPTGDTRIDNRLT